MDKDVSAKQFLRGRHKLRHQPIVLLPMHGEGCGWPSAGCKSPVPSSECRVPGSDFRVPGSVEKLFYRKPGGQLRHHSWWWRSSETVQPKPERWLTKATPLPARRTPADPRHSSVWFWILGFRRSPVWFRISDFRHLSIVFRISGCGCLYP